MGSVAFKLAVALEIECAELLRRGKQIPGRLVGEQMDASRDLTAEETVLFRRLVELLYCTPTLIDMAVATPEEREAEFGPMQATVYFAQAGEGGPIKIGITSGTLKSRIAQIQNGNPAKITVRAAIFGATAKDERELHKKFSKRRMQGEWFEPCPELEAVMAEHAFLDARLTAGDGPL
jgi:hypothetical protein